MEQYIIMRFKEDRYAVSISDIHEIIEFQPITAIPRSHYFLEGVINLRGKIVPVISLAKRLNQTSAASTKHTRIVVVNHGVDVVGIIVDAVEQVVTFEEFSDPPAASRVFSKVGMADDLVVPIFSIKNLLESEGDQSHAG